MRADDPAERPEAAVCGRFALNDPMSHSGWGAAHRWADAQGLTLRPTLVTGTHRNCLAMVVEGHADPAAIDAVT